MTLLGMLTMICGFLGIIAFGVLGATRSIPAAVITHAALFLAFVAFHIQRSGGFSQWLSQKVVASYSVHFSIIVLIGTAFLIGGVCIATIVQPGIESNSMTKSDQIYFGAIFACIGGGIILSALGNAMPTNKMKRQNKAEMATPRKPSD